MKPQRHAPPAEPPPFGWPPHNTIALRRRALDVAAGLDLRGAPAVAAAVLVEVAQRDAGAGMSDRAFEAWLDAVARIRSADVG